MESYSVDDARRVLTLNVSTGFATQNFTEKSVGYYYKRLAKALPKPYNRYQLRINTAGMPIEHSYLAQSCVAVAHPEDGDASTTMARRG